MPETSILTNGGFLIRIKFFMVEFLKSIYITKSVRKRFTRKAKKIVALRPQPLLCIATDPCNPESEVRPKYPVC